jgi:pimeloyl-ACP methyl ester carboxylesterase
MSKRDVLLAAAVVAAGAAAGAVIERAAVGRLVPPARGPVIGPLDGEHVTVESFDGTPLAVTLTGRDVGPAVVFAHGIVETSAVWHYQMGDPVLADRYRLIAYDARGHGRSGPARGTSSQTEFSARSHALDLAAVLEACTPEPVVVVGHSMGGITVQALWDLDPRAIVGRRVAGIVLVNTTYTADLHGFRGRRGAFSSYAYGRGERFVRRVAAMERLVRALRPGESDLTLIGARLAYGKNPSPEHIAASMRMYLTTSSATIAAGIDMATTDLQHVLAQIDVPALVIAGAEDRVTPPGLSETLAEQIPQAELVVFDDCGHIAPFERSSELTSLITKFCEQHL